MDQDGMHTIRSTLTSRIETLMLSIGEMQLSTLSEELDSIRALASRHKLRPVERLASLLGSVIAYNGHRQIAFNYLDLMRDAASCDDDRPDVAAAYLAAASLRGCRPYMGD